MLSLQQVGTEIMSGTIRKFYVFLGPEYQVKLKYIGMIAEHINGEIICADSVQSVIESQKTRQLVKLNPKVYVVRYDSEFVKSLSSSTVSTIDDLKVDGSIICLYDNDTYYDKFDKYLPTYSTYVPWVSSKFISKYLKSDLPGASDEVIKIAVSIGENYARSLTIAKCLSSIPVEYVLSHDTNYYKSLFGKFDVSKEDEIRRGVAAKNVNYLVKVLDDYSDLDTVMYTIFSTLLDIEKLKQNKYIESDIREYVDQWSYEDIYNMFNHTYQQLNNVRSITSSMYEVVVYLISLCGFKHVPSVEVM